MANNPSANDAQELRIRVRVGANVPDLYDRLVACKRPGVEILHLVRLGLSFEKIMQAQQAPFVWGPQLALGIKDSSSLGQPMVPVTALSEARSSESVNPFAGVSVDQFAEELGLSAAYFSMGPMQASSA